MKINKNPESNSKPNLLVDGDEGEKDNSPAIYLNLTTKKHIIDQKRLKPGKITLPHPLNTSSTKTICLITTDPQRTYKDIVASPAFPSALAARITRVIDIKKLKKKYNQYEAQRQLRSNHDIFLADDRIITQLPKALGKTFYSAAATRPVPVDLQAPAPRTEGKRIARAKDGPRTGSAKEIAAEIEKAIHATLVHLSPSTNTSVKVGHSSWEPEKIVENVETVASVLIERFVPKKWRGVKSIHIKGPETTALPIWLADELWVDEGDVLDEEQVRKVVEANTSKKRKRIAEKSEADGGKVEKKGKKAKVVESNDDKLDKEIALRKEKLKKQKLQVALDLGNDVSRATKKTKKVKEVAV